MEGNQKLIDALNDLLADELTAINQYIVHAEMCEDWGYLKLYDGFKKRSFAEMKHAESLIARILFLGGTPRVDKLLKMHIGDTVERMIHNDHMSEEAAIKAYNDAIKLAIEVGDNATKDFLQGILNDEDTHIDELEELMDQVEQMGMPIFLTTKMEK